jgi:hypothetical protein
MTTNSVTPSMPDCGWSGCGHLAPIEVLVTVRGEPPGFACSVGRYCVGHAVITGIEAQARHGGELWYSTPLDAVFPRGDAVARLN